VSPSPGVEATLTRLVAHGTLVLVLGRWWVAVLIGVGALAVGLILPLGWARIRSAKRILTVDDVPATDVALVLGAGVRSDGQPSRILQGRLRVAQALFEAGKVRRILVSGSPRSRGHSEPVVMRNFLVAQGISYDAVLLDESGVDTWCSCRGAAREFGLRQVTVVSTRFHLPRAVSLCRRAGIDAYAVGHDAAADGLRRVSARGARREVLATIKAFWRR
jgi:vancomycin permeability regulator SanA